MECRYSSPSNQQSRVSSEPMTTTATATTLTQLPVEILDIIIQYLPKDPAARQSCVHSLALSGSRQLFEYLVPILYRSPIFSAFQHGGLHQQILKLSISECTLQYTSFIEC